MNLSARDRQDLRRAVLASMARKVASGADASALRELLRTADLGRAQQVEELSAAALQGTWAILSEDWQCRGTYFTARALYRDADCAAVVSGAGEMVAPAVPEAEEPDVVWMSHADLARIAQAVVTP